MEVGKKIATAASFFLVILSSILLLLTYVPAHASAQCAPTKPQVSWVIRNVSWKSYNDYLNRLLSVNMAFSSSGAPAYATTIISASNSESVTLTGTLPLAVGDISVGSTILKELKYFVPVGVTHFRTSLYVSARDNCVNDYFYPRPLNSVARYSLLSTSDNGFGQVSVSIKWDPEFDNDHDAVATVKYRLYPSNWWDSILPEYQISSIEPHDADDATFVVDDLLPGRYYDVAVEMSDDDGVDGPRLQESKARLLRDNRFTVTNILNNPYPGNFDEVRVRDYYNGSLFWYSAQGVWEYGDGYEYVYRYGANSIYSVVRGKTAWQSAIDRSNNRIYIAGELPRFDGSHNYRAMIGIIYEDASPPWLKVYSVPYTDDCNEFIGVALDTTGNRLLVGERHAGTPLKDSPWPNGGGFWSIQLGSDGKPTNYARVYQDPLNRGWDKMVVYDGRLYVKISDTLISANLADIPATGAMPASAWRTEYPSGIYGMMVSAWHGLVVVRDGGNYASLNIYNGSQWNVIESNQVFPGEGIYELPDHRFVITRPRDGSSHHVQVASVTGEWENLGVFPGSGPSSNYAVSPDGNIFYATITPGKVFRIDYVP